MVTPAWKVDLTEAQFQQQVTQLAELYGWQWAHFRPAMTKYGWRTSVSGPLGAGFPDLILAKGERLLFVELKASRRKVSGLQDVVLGVLSKCAEVYVWRPEQWEEVMEALGNANEGNAGKSAEEPMDGLQAHPRIG